MTPWTVPSSGFQEMPYMPVATWIQCAVSMADIPEFSVPTPENRGATPIAKHSQGSRVLSGGGQPSVLVVFLLCPKFEKVAAVKKCMTEGVETGFV